MIVLPPVYPILDGDCLYARGVGMQKAAEALLEARVQILQFRWKGHFSREVYTQAERVRDLCAGAGAAFVLNDRADYAALLGSALHLGQEDLPPAAARAITGPGLAIGFSTHNQTQFLAAQNEPVDYVALGPIFATASKRNPDPVVGTGELARLCAHTRMPIVAIGGITRENARDVWNAGAHSVAVVADLYPPECSKAAIRERAEEWLKLAHG